MQIGEVAARTELSLRTIRHYEETGLVVPSARSQGGFRLYTETDVARLMVIRRMKPLGFTLDQMRDLLDATDRLDNEPGLDTGEREILLGRVREFEQADKPSRSTSSASSWPAPRTSPKRSVRVCTRPHRPGPDPWCPAAPAAVRLRPC